MAPTENDRLIMCKCGNWKLPLAVCPICDKKLRINSKGEVESTDPGLTVVGVVTEADGSQWVKYEDYLELEARFLKLWEQLY